MQAIDSQSIIDEQELIDFINDGIPNIGSMWHFCKLDELVFRLDRFEHKRRHAAIAQKKSGMTTKTTNNNKTSPAVQPNTVGTTENSIRCYNCFQCGEVGLYLRDYPNRVRTVATITVDGAVDADPVNVL